MYEKVFAYLDAHAEDYAAQLCRWVEVPSVKGEATPDAPFGKDVRRMLDMAMADAKAFGYETRDFDGYACDITLPGESEEAIAVLGHLDVVPAGDNWATPPFTATRVGDQIFARGTSDDKGPALAALYAMNAIKAAGIPLKKSIRLILGCDEESGWEDMAYYCAHTEMPEVGFSPDASFPIINTEKGMIHGFFTGKLAEDGLQVKQLWTGERVNVIPGESKALVAGGQEVADKVAAYAEKTGLPYTAEVTADGVWVTAEGIPGHSAYPEGRRNAIGMMLVLFMLLPTFVAGLFRAQNAALHNLIEGVIKVAIFLAYLILCSKQKDVRRVFCYHGAEHKTIFCYEAGLPLTVENARIQPKHHPRCGTSFLFVVIIVSILCSSIVFSYVNWQNIWVRIGMHLLLLIPVVGITYEFNRLVGRHDNALTRVLSAPGMWLQNFTVNEPDDSMLEVAIEALKLVLPEEEGKDRW